MKRAGVIFAAMVLALTFSLAKAKGLEGRSQEEGTEYKEILPALLPKNKEMEAWRITSSPQFFAPQDLWEYIDGQAEMYLDYGFEHLLTAEYTAVGGATSMVVDIYRMQSPRHAFGIYAAERSPHDRFIKIGVQGYASKNVLNFWKGLYYVKLTSLQSGSETEAILTKMAGLIDAKIKGNYSEPELFSVFPKTDRIQMSERFIPKNFLGLSFLKDGYRVSYKTGERIYQVFLIKNSSPDVATEVFGKYQAFLRSQNESVSHSQQTDYQLAFTRSEKGGVIFQYDAFLGGVLNMADVSKAEKIIEEVIQKLKRIE